jgi:IS1 family transposase
MNFGPSLEKKENLNDQELELGANSKEFSENQGDRWTFVAILPDSSFIHTLHHGERNLEQATKFVSKIKSKSDKQSPLFASDDWFYEKALLANYGYDYIPTYKGIGRYPKVKRLPLADLKYVQVQKKRDAKGRLEEIKYSIVYGTPQSINQVFAKAERCKTINTVYVESRNGKFRKDDARLIRRTLCHSKKAVFHDAQANFTAQIMNYTRTNSALKILLNPDAARFEQKYQHRTPAMAQNLIDKPLTVKELLFIRPQISP